MSARDADIEAGIRLGLDYAAQFLDGAAVGLRVSGLSAFAEVLVSAGNELRATVPQRVRDGDSS